MFASLLLCLLAWQDLARRLLPNAVVGLYAALFFPHAWLSGFPFSQVGGHLLWALSGFLVLFCLFVLGGMAGGDVKLGSAVLLWAGTASGWMSVVVIAWVGGIVAVLGWLSDRRAIRKLGLACRFLRWGRNLISARRGVPYGVALAAGGLYAIWHEIQF